MNINYGYERCTTVQGRIRLTILVYTVHHYNVRFKKNIYLNDT